MGEKGNDIVGSTVGSSVGDAVGDVEHGGAPQAGGQPGFGLNEGIGGYLATDPRPAVTEAAWLPGERDHRVPRPPDSPK